VGAVSWPDPGHREPEREILERSPGWWSRALTLAERRLRLDRLPGVGWLRRVRRNPRRAAALGVLGVLVLAGTAVGVVVTQQRSAPAARPPASTAPDTGIVGLNSGGILRSGVQQITSHGSTRYVIVAGGGGPLTPPPVCAEFAGAVPGGLGAGSRTVLGDVVVPAARLAMLRNGNGVWRYWQQATFLVRGGSPPVTISVPRAYRASAALDLETNGIGTTFRVKACRVRTTWAVETGGFYLKAPAACVPLNIQVGSRSATEWFGLGESCPAAKG
jgi:hypothetical protein